MLESVLSSDDGPLGGPYRADMNTQSKAEARVAVVAADPGSLGSLTVSPGFGSSPIVERDVGAFLRDRVERPGGRCVVAVDGHRIVGFLVVAPPASGDRFSGIGCLMEILAVEVVGAYQGQGVFREMFKTAFRGDLEDLALFAVADPVQRRRRESVRGFRDRMLAVFGSVGFFPYPTDYPAVTMRRDVVFLVRIGRGVPKHDAEAFVEELHGGPRTEHVAVHVADADLRNLVRTDLERSGFVVDQVGARPRPAAGVDVLVTEFEANGAPVVIRIVDDERVTFTDAGVRVPVTQLDRLPGIVRTEIARRRYAR